MQQHQAEEEEEAQRRPVVPTGYRFAPAPEELIRCYLNPWVAAAGPVVPGVVCVADIYACNPGALTSRFRDRGHDGSWYFLCVARWKSGIGARVNRCVRGGGTWHASTKRKAVAREGYRQGFEYRAAGNGKTAWIMVEFVTNLEAATDGEGVKVICKVYHSPRALPAVDAVVEQDETKSNKVAKRPLLMHGDQYDVGRHYIAGTSRHQGGLMTSAATVDAGGGSKRRRARLLPLDDDHGRAAAYSATIMEKPPAECNAGTPSQQSSPESSVTCQQQGRCTGDVIGGEGVPSVPVDDSVYTEVLAVPPMDYGCFDEVAKLGWPPNDWLANGEFNFDGVEGGDEPTIAAT